jgi:deazaflavin-dependent oxidoreductase (nitroreductase family)
VDQRNEPFDEPPADQIPVISRMHVAAMEQSDDDMVWIGAGMHQLLLRTVGRKSGNEHKVALPYWVDANGHRIVVGSFAGAKDHPAWYLNLVAQPDVVIRLQHQGDKQARAEVLSGDDRATVWTAMTADRPYYVNYQGRTERELPLIRFIVTD